VSAGRRLLAVLLVAVAALAALVAPVTGGRPATQAVAAAADTSQFDPGNIITDQLFFDGSAMTAATVQRFLDERNPDCRPGGDGTPCLKNYRQTTPDRDATASCPTRYVGAANESAATIIARVGRACGVSQRVLLVLLQKEQSLVTASGSGLYADRYRKATGYACPDTAPCDTRYYGFFNQLYSAASRYKTYAANPDGYNHHAGVVNSVRYHPDPACGSSQVRIRNQATAGLYNYTPYQPNAAALAAYKGTGNGCSAYGNRNFWIFFTEWFGSTQTPGAGALADFYMSTGGADGPLGQVTRPVECGLVGNGCRQGYQNGWITWSPATGAKAVIGAIKNLWISTGALDGVLGYPTTSVSTLAGGGQYAHFQGGSIYWTSTTGPRALLGPIRTYWNSTGGTSGVLRYPTHSVTNTADGGQYAHFQGGSVYWTAATGARALLGSIRTFWNSTGGTGGVLGYPTQSVSRLPNGGEFARFEGGSVWWTNATGPKALLGPIEDLWESTGGVDGPLGYPTQSVSTAADGTGQYAHFQGGSVYWSPATGARAMVGPIEALWEADGAERGPLGYPISSVYDAAGGGQIAHFQRGSIHRAADGTVHTVEGPVRDLWLSARADAGLLGVPTSDTVTTADGQGRTATFTGGSVWWTQETGARAMLGPIEALWRARSAEAGDLGYPTGSVSTAGDGVGQYAHFQGGSVYWSPDTGARVVDGAVRDLWLSTRQVLGPMGYPTADVRDTADGDGRVGRFQRGSIWWTEQTGARAMLGPVEKLWSSTGGERGVLGYPTQSVSTARDGAGQYARFTGGSIWWSRTTGARALLGPIEEYWKAAGAERGTLGYPTQSVSSSADGGQYARFVGGAVAWSPDTAARSVRGANLTVWADAGRESGALGYPTSEPYRVAGGTWQDFEGGTIRRSDATGRTWAQLS
jgi:uncharacterized protein with LGFP repeats